MFDYKLLEALALVVDEGGFERAARVLNRSQSAVSQRIRQLEDQMGQALVVRSTPVRATGAGRRLVAHYRQVVQLEGDLNTEFGPNGGPGFTPLRIGVNADSLATWFIDALVPFLESRRILLDLSVDDQDRTHLMLKNGEVAGCLSTEPRAMQGCACAHLGRMSYLCMAAPGFMKRWFLHGLDEDSARRAPAVVFNRKDETHSRFLEGLFPGRGIMPPTHYLPSSERFVDLIAAGLAYGLVPDIQAGPHLEAGTLVDLAPGRGVPVDLYWHHWNLDTPGVSELADALKRHAARVLEP